MNTLIGTELWQLADWLKTRQISSRELCLAALAAIESSGGRLNAWLDRCSEEQVLAQAARADQALAAGQPVSPLAGIPFAVKDTLCTSGLATTCASAILQGYHPGYDATAVSRLLQGGSVLIGKTNCDEFAMGRTSESSAAGPVRNPWDPARSAGGSSGGSAAAVAARQVCFALGSDTGGSVRQPAAWCHLTGLKPSYGLVSRYGLVAHASSLDQIGPMARSARDCALVMAQIAGHDPQDSTSIAAGQRIPDFSSVHGRTDQLEGLTIGWPDGGLTAETDPEISRMIRQTADRFKQRGAVLNPISLPPLDLAVSAYYLIACAEASSNLSRYDGTQTGSSEQRHPDQTGEALAERRGRDLGLSVRRRVLLGTYALSAGYYDEWYLKACQVRSRQLAEWLRVVENCDAVLLPTTPDLPSEIGVSSADPLTRYLADAYTVPANLTGFPAVSFPCGFSRTGLPVGAQLIGRPLSDARLLDIAAAYQTATGFRAPESERKGTAHGL